MLELLFGRGRGYEEAVPVTCGEPADDAGAADGGVHDGDDVPELCLECRVEVGASLESGEAVAVSQLGEHSDVAAVFELGACMLGVSRRLCVTKYNVRVAIFNR